MSKTKRITNYTIFLEKKLGEGAFGKVYCGQHDQTKQKCAIKMLERKIIDKDEYIKNAVFAEIEILKSLKSPNIVGFYDVMQSDNYYYIVQQFCDSGDLRNLLQKNKKVSQSVAIKMLTDMCNGFVELIKQGVVHRDLKPENVLINQQVLKLADFGFSKKLNNKRVKNQTMVGTPLYMSIQILKGQPYTAKCDIWALGLIFYELILGRTPWDANTEYELINNIEKKPLIIPNNFITRCLGIYEKQRFCWDELLKHDIFKGYFNSYFQKSTVLENRFKGFMNNFRYQIQSQNIDLERLLKNLGFTKASNLSFDDFNRFVESIDHNITNQERRYIFQKLDSDDSNTIEYGELEICLKKNNIPMQSKRVQLVKREVNDNSQINLLKKQLNNKIYQAYQKLISVMENKNLSLSDVFENYTGNKGIFTIAQFSKFMSKLDKSFTAQQIKLVFDMIDCQSGSGITFEQFHSYFCKVTGEPPKKFMVQQFYNDNLNQASNLNQVNQINYQNGSYNNQKPFNQYNQPFQNNNPNFMFSQPNLYGTPPNLSGNFGSPPIQYINQPNIYGQPNFNYMPNISQQWNGWSDNQYGYPNQPPNNNNNGW